jgi:hypothetical protein
MEPKMPYLAAAQDYAENVRALFAVTGAPTGERGVSGLGSPAALAAQAEKLAPLSSALTAEAEKRLLTDTDPDSRAQASSQLLAKALTDLTVSAHLLQAAQDEDEGLSKGESSATERSAGDSDATEELLQIVVGEVRADASSVERSVETPKDIASARVGLSQTIEDTLALISERTSKTGTAALGGLFGVGLGQAAQAAGLLGQNIAQAFGQADKLGRLYGLFRDFALKAYESVVTLLGPAVAKIVGQQVMSWVAEVKEAKFFSGLLEKLYQTKETQAALLPIVMASNADPQKFLIGIQQVEGLGQKCSQQTALIDKLLKGIRYLGAVPIAVLPYGALLMAAIYVGICGYVVLNGADYVDADHVKVLDRIPGVRRIVAANLAS